VKKIFLAFTLLLGSVACGTPSEEWTTETQDGFMTVCQWMTYEAAKDDGLRAKDVCGCILDGLMANWDEKTYLSWEQPTRDAASHPHGVECWDAEPKF